MISLVEYIQLHEGLFSSKPKASYKSHGFSENKNVDSFLFCIFGDSDNSSVIKKIANWLESSNRILSKSKYDLFIKGESNRFSQTSFEDCHIEKDLTKLYEKLGKEYDDGEFGDLTFRQVKAKNSKYLHGIVFLNEGKPLAVILENIKATRKANGVK